MNETFRYPVTAVRRGQRGTIAEAPPEPPASMNGRLRTGAVLLLGALLLGAAAGCGPRDGGSATGTSGASQAPSHPPAIVIEMTIEPPAVGMATVTARVSDAVGPVTGAEVEARGDMTHAGMAPALARLEEAEPGSYTTSEFDLSMAGDWIITIEVEAADGRKATSETFVFVGVR